MLVKIEIFIAVVIATFFLLVTFAFYGVLLMDVIR